LHEELTDSKDFEEKMKLYQKMKAKLWEGTTILRRKDQPKLMLSLNKGVL
jgi:hypothetical protein